MKKIDVACIIDDDPIFVFATKKLMQLTEFCNSFMVFHNGEEAINHLQPLLKAGEKIPDIILLDLNMPVMDGWQFLDAFIEIPCSKTITIYIVSSSKNPSDFERARQYGQVNNYIIKPVTPEMLRTIIEAH